jgi:hypothetical protein
LYLLGAGLEYEIRWCYTNYSLRHSPGRQVAVCPSRALLPWRLNGAEVLQSAGRTEQAWHHHVGTGTFVHASQARARGEHACAMESHARLACACAHGMTSTCFMMDFMACLPH